MIRESEAITIFNIDTVVTQFTANRIHAVDYILASDDSVTIVAVFNELTAHNQITVFSKRNSAAVIGVLPT